MKTLALTVVVYIMLLSCAAFIYYRPGAAMLAIGALLLLVFAYAIALTCMGELDLGRPRDNEED